jgi:hypothetical protein
MEWLILLAILVLAGLALAPDVVVKILLVLAWGAGLLSLAFPLYRWLSQ